MDQKLADAIDVLVEKVEQRTKDLNEMKKLINSLCKEAGRQVLYENIDDSPRMGLGSVRSDQFYGKSPLVAAHEYLKIRGQAVSPEDIVRALEDGGFDFETQGWKKEDRVRAVAISMGKNKQTFHRLPNGTYGLVELYPALGTRNLVLHKRKRKASRQTRKRTKKTARKRASTKRAKGDSPLKQGVYQIMGDGRVRSLEEIVQLVQRNLRGPVKRYLVVLVLKGKRFQKKNGKFRLE